MKSSDPSRLAYWLIKDIDKAIRDYDMIQDGDMIGVAVSGGKDSLSLLRLLDYRRKYSQYKYTLCAIHILGDSKGPNHQQNPDLIDWLSSNDYDYEVEPMILPEGEDLPMKCHRCTWNRRRTLFEIANRRGCNKVALGHHGDDFAQTTLLNLIFSGKVETMAPMGNYFDGLFHIIRPMCYLAEKEIKRFAVANNFPVTLSECPQTDTSRRKRAADLILNAEIYCKDIRINLLRAGLKGNNSRHN